ncbi:MAG: MBL fold metallo-hydrolase [Bacteroidales bacterium]|jgi:glyoxylase-like metal-dependent hydrolase (beta-lactamase superfamily II)|nr:MBL fold metallo-hydrolase [Bacteroidales bacterium]
MKNYLTLLLCFMSMLSVQCKQQGASAETPEAQETQEVQNAAVYQGEGFTLYTLNESSRNGNASILVGASEEMIKETMPDGTYPMATNCFLLVLPPSQKDTNGKKILFDAGTSAEILLNNLKKIDIAPEEIDMVMITHSHGDHIGGLINNGKATFPNAMILLSSEEADFWQSKNSSSCNEAMKLYKPFIRFDSDDWQVQSGNSTIRSVNAPGHTPGHIAYMINNEVMIWGDLTHASAIQMKYPEIAVTYDANPEDAIASRKKIFNYLFNENHGIKAYAGMHVPEGIEHIKVISKNSNEK